MKKSVLKPIWLIVALLMVVSLACNLPIIGKIGSSTQGTDEPSKTDSGNTFSSGTLVTKLSDVQDAVVQIEAEGTFLDPEFGLQVNSAGRGTGFIIDPDGYAVTNNHVVTGAALVKVWVNGESTARNAKVVAYSECNDLALIKIDGSDFSYLEWYNGEISTGMEVYLAGYPLGEPEFSLTKGIISKTNTSGDTSWTAISGGVLGHDATGNPGNSGGPLVTSNGQVVGIHFASRSSANQYFAISEETAKQVIPTLRKGTNFESIGVNGSVVSNDDGSVFGVWVASVASGSPADKAGVKSGDIITQLEGLVVGTDGTMADYCSVIRTHDEGSALSITVLRWGTGEILEGQLNGRELEVTGKFDGSTGSSSGGTTSGTDTGSSSSDEAPAYFTDEFENGLSNYSYFTMGKGGENGMDIYTEDGKLVFDLNGEYLWPYLMYDPYTYKNVALQFEAENLGNNNNNVSFVCRYDPDRGWYEFNVANNGLYWILYYDAVEANDYKTLFDGGSQSINMGRATNTYGVICEGDSLSLYINGHLERTVKDTNLKEGQVGVSVSSFDSFPVRVDIDWLKISEP
ncbi:MAG: trypsin-like peptidase domain-containing protein [Anaerolineaceae bacterium]|nr:trypsin-like peptidase domain-containing protein [Anaerolineaceae bacterium]